MIETILTITTIVVGLVIVVSVLRYETKHMNDNFKPLY